MISQDDVANTDPSVAYVIGPDHVRRPLPGFEYTTEQFEALNLTVGPDDDVIITDPAEGSEGKPKKAKRGRPSKTETPVDPETPVQIADSGIATGVSADDSDDSDKSDVESDPSPMKVDNDIIQTR